MNQVSTSSRLALIERHVRIAREAVAELEVAMVASQFASPIVGMNEKVSAKEKCSAVAAHFNKIVQSNVNAAAEHFNAILGVSTEAPPDAPVEEPKTEPVAKPKLHLAE